MKVTAVSDIHYRWFKTPPTDLLIVAGDLTIEGNRQEVKWFANWLKVQPAKHKVYIAGNHDLLFERDPAQVAAIMAEVDAHYLQDSGIVIDGISIYGTPWVPECGDDFAFMKPRGSPELKAVWSQIPDRVDILVTHTPPFGILDFANGVGPVGDVQLFERVREVNPRYHVFGHIHEARGTTRLGRTVFINAAICNNWNDPVHAPIQFEVRKRKPSRPNT